MTAILVFSSPSFVPLLAAFMSCWTWSEEEEDTRQRGSVRAECCGARDLITYSAPLERETVEKRRRSGAQRAHHESHHLRLPVGRCAASNQRGFEHITER